MVDRTYTDAELDEAIAAISEPQRLRAAQELVTRVAPALQRVLGARSRRAAGSTGPRPGGARGRRPGGPRGADARGRDAARRRDPPGHARGGRRGVPAGARARPRARRQNETNRRIDDDGSSVSRPRVLHAVGRRSTTVLIDPFLTGNPKGAIAAEDVAATTILLTHGHHDHLGDTVAIAKRTGATVVAITEIAGELGEEGVDVARPEPRRDREVRLGHGQARAGAAHLDDAQGHGQPARRAADQLRGHGRLPPRRHLPVLRPAAGRQAHADRHRADVHRRALHDGPHRRGRGRLADRRQDRDSLSLQHVPADRDRRAGVQVRRRVGDRLQRRRSSSPATRHTT